MVLVVLFWCFLVAFAICAAWGWQAGASAPPWVPWVGNLLLILMLAILGFKALGNPIS